MYKLVIAAKRDENADDVSNRGGVSECWAMIHSFGPLLPTTGRNLEQRKLTLNL